MFFKVSTFFRISEFMKAKKKLRPLETLWPLFVKKINACLKAGPIKKLAIMVIMQTSEVIKKLNGAQG